MKLPTQIKLLLAALAAAASLVSLKATTIDFESFSNGQIVSGPGVFSDLTFTSSGRVIRAYAGNPGPDFGGSMMAGGDDFVGNPFRADFLLGGINSVSVVMGDYNADADDLFIYAYDAANNLLDSATFALPSSTYGGPALSVSSVSGNIAYVLFGSTGTFSSSVYWDNFTYTATDRVPDAGMTAVLFGLGLLGLASMRRFTRVARA